MPSFLEILDRAAKSIEERRRVSYRALQREFDLDDEALADLKTELVDVRRVAVDVDGTMLEWSRQTGTTSSVGATADATGPVEDPPPSARPEPPTPPPPSPQPPRAERVAKKSRWVISLGAALVIGGVLLPWARSTATLQGVGSQTRTFTGLDLNEGVIAIALGIANALLGFAAAGRAVPRRLAAVIVLVVGVAVIGIVGRVFLQMEEANSQFNNFRGSFGSVLRETIRNYTRPEAGIGVTLIGGGLLALGGLAALIVASRRSPNR